MAGAYAVSNAQLQFWLLEQLAATPSEYAVTAAWHVIGPLDIEVLGAALARVAARHAILTTGLAASERGLEAVPGRAAQPTLSLAECLNDDPQSAAASAVQSLTAERFDLARGPVLRAAAVRLARDEDEYVLAIALHHVAADGASVGILARDWSAQYEALVNGEDARLPPLSATYADLVAWECAASTAERAHRDRQFWRERLLDARELRLPTDRPRPSRRSGRGGAVFLEFGAQLTAAVDTFARRASATPFVVLLAGFQILLARLARQNDVLVGTSVAVRPERRFEPLMGPFVNTVAIRDRLRPDMSFRELVSNARSVLLDALDHAALPFADVVESVRPARDGNRSPLVRVLAVLQDAASPPRLGSASVRPIEIVPARAQFDLTLALRREDGLLRGRLEYDADLFGHKTAVEWAQALRTLIEAAVADGELSISALPMAAGQPHTEAPPGNGDDRTAPSERAPFEGGDETGAFTLLEQTVALAIAELLGVPRVGRDDDFFELGGHSLLAAKLVSALGRRLGKEVPLEIVFDAPTVGEMASAIAAVPGDAVTDGPVPVVRDDGCAPLSSGQRRLWFLDRLTLGSSEYVVSAAWRVEGPLDRDALAGALSVIVARHEVLRTRVVVRDGRPVQRVEEAGSPGWAALEVAAVSGDEEYERALAAASTAPFDLGEGPVFRARLLARASECHTLVIAAHHIAFDGWSMAVFCDELRVAYGAQIRGEAPELPVLSVQYADYAVWQQRRAETQEYAESLAFWCRRLDDLPVLELPADRPRPAVRSTEGAAHRFVIGRSLTACLHEMGSKHGTTLFMTLLAAYQAFLFRLSGQHDIVVGTPVAARQHRSLEPLIGFFANTLVMRADFSGEPSFAGVLERTRQYAIDAYSRQGVPFEHLVEALNPTRDLGRTPLFSTMFALQQPLANPQLAKTRTVAQPLAWRTAKTDISLLVTPVGDTLHAAFEYSTDLYDPGTIARWAGYFETFVRHLVSDPGQLIGHVSLLSPAERAACLRRTTGRAQLPAPPLGLHERFAVRAGCVPEAPALVEGIATLSYRQLDRRANHLASRLREVGVRPGEVVGILTGATAEHVLGVLAVHKAGAAYVPLDPDHPPARQRLLAERSHARAILVGERGEGSGDGAVCLPRLRIDLDGPQAAAPPSSPPVAGATVAYIMFTSGSTGVPKGVMVPHAGITNLIDAFTALHALRPDDRGSWLTSPSWDVSLYEIFSPLLAGSALHVVPPRARANARLLHSWLREHAITSAYVPAFLLEEFAGLLTESPLALRRLEVGAEPIPARLLATIRGRIPGVAIINGYGPTEASVAASLHLVTGDRAGRIPIGRPIPNMAAHVLDGCLEPAPAGVIGEVCIAGIGLAHGYLADPRRTAETFVPDPHARQPGARLFRTGDRAHTDDDGVLHFNGRTDHQIKIRGQRIELGEIEGILSTLGGVRHAAVVVRSDAGATRLLGFVEPIEGAQLDPEEIRDQARQHLPPGMVPAQVVVLDRLPLTTAGKVDRKALPAVATPDQATGSPLRTPTEHLLAAIWADVLGRPITSAAADFFAAGGDSLAATRAMFHIGDALHRELPVRLLFEHPTLKLLARALDTEDTNGAGIAAPASALREAAELPPDVRPRRSRRRGSGERILVTGATGFLGAFLLAEIVRTIDQPATCLVRAADDVSAASRLRAALTGYGLEEIPGLQVVAGDLAAPRLGLDEATYAELRRHLGAVYHCAAGTDLMARYTALFDANVTATRNVLELACAASGAVVHHISTASVLSSDGREVTIDDVEGSLPPNGYVQTKWVGEQLAIEAARRGLPVSIYRPGRVGPHSTSGACNQRDFLVRLLAGSIRLGAAPVLPTRTRTLAVDAAAAAIVQLSRASGGRRHVLEHPEATPFSALLDAIDAWGYPLRRVKPAAWITEARHRLGNDPVVVPILPLVAELVASGGAAQSLQPDSLIASGIAIPDQVALIGPMLGYLADLGVIPTARPRRFT